MADRIEPRFFATLRQDLRQVGSGIRREGVRRPVARTFTELQEFYLSPQQRARLARMRRVRRWFSVAWGLLKALSLRLTPVRRVLLLIAFVLYITSFQAADPESGVRITNSPFLPFVLVLLVLMLELKDKLLARDELKAGRAVQQALMPSGPPTLAGWDIALFTRPANDVGGDLVDWQRLDGRHTVVAIGDVAGKGLPAALLMAKLQATLRALAEDGTSLADLGSRVNRIFVRDGLPHSFTTLVYLALEAEGDRVSVLNAGHMPPLLVRGGEIEELPRGGPALGLTGSAVFAHHAVTLSAGDVLIVYTDGVTEAMNADGEFFGDERLRLLVEALGSTTAAEAIERIVGAVDAFVGDAPAHDDVSLAVLRRIHSN